MGKILVTGAAGFIGWRTCTYLLHTGIEGIVGVDNMNDYYDLALKEYRLSELRKRGNFQFIKTDIENLGALKELFAAHSFDSVINLAARAGVKYSMENPFVYMTTNAQGTLNLLEVMKERGIPKMVLASTSSLYAGQPMPFHEDLPVNTPISPYAASKKAAEIMAYAYHHLYGIDISVLRYFTVYGPAGRPDMSIFRFIKWIDEGTDIELFGDGTQSRDFTYVDDIAEGTIRALRNVGYQIINLGGGKNPISLLQVIAIIEKELGKKARLDIKPFHKTDIRETWADITKAQKVLGWSPKIDFETGVRNTIKWYRENKTWISKIKL